MALDRTTDLGLNDIYAQMMKTQTEQLKEAVNSGNSVHGPIADYSKEFSASVTSSIDNDTVEAKLKDLEAGTDLTSADKKIINCIRNLSTATNKAIEDFRTKMTNIKYDFVVTQKAKEAGSSEDALEGADHGEESVVAADEVATPAETETANESVVASPTMLGYLLESGAALTVFSVAKAGSKPFKNKTNQVVYKSKKAAKADRADDLADDCSIYSSTIESADLGGGNGEWFVSKAGYVFTEL